MSTSMSTRWSSRLRRFVAARLSPEGQLGLHLTVGVALMLLAMVVFHEIAEAVMGAGQITVIDLQVAHWFNRHALPWLTSFLLVYTDLHGVLGALVLTALLAWYFYRQRASYWLFTLLICVPGVMILNVLLKSVFGRLRPSFEQPLLQRVLESYSFPSGHTATSTALYGVLGAYLICRTAPGAWGKRTAIALLAFLMAALVGFSRIYLGAHYLSDVLAAMAESAGWLAICIAGVSTLRRRRAIRPTK
ncbi:MULTISPECIES: phosphatase PAP2 family protein [unclassified Janthinobacterium]|uniref:phosphatase PAP2 family protein n=1 Tax=unclassified Janthinobacterium TaxID=2610881 RepID=UPI0017F22533|nr:MULTISPECIES: phosphatase PAP2 family protein [unclassified Janthinobacterium]MBB5369272.1 undecaprenyl-diphosphatase [Janthinobacterium sp. K2C7]MBB5381192.1 undecaprenyl-diphosphatase [Janthinobacterium sp. K2Li3]MBB5387655.1 undecaprenyl-diphosphatase [Janthinobacterium sp. K2E3]